MAQLYSGEGLRSRYTVTGQDSQQLFEAISGKKYYREMRQPAYRVMSLLVADCIAQAVRAVFYLDGGTENRVECVREKRGHASLLGQP